MGRLSKPPLLLISIMLIKITSMHFWLLWCGVWRLGEIMSWVLFYLLIFCITKNRLIRGVSILIAVLSVSMIFIEAVPDALYFNLIAIFWVLAGLLTVFSNHNEYLFKLIRILFLSLTILNFGHQLFGNPFVSETWQYIATFPILYFMGYRAIQQPIEIDEI